jgi:two-component system, OmpR family, sensor kinase
MPACAGMTELQPFRTSSTLGPLYRRLLLWFLAANIITPLVSVFVTEHIVRYSMGANPDWAALAQSADAAYIAGGTRGLQEWSDTTRRQEHVVSTLFENGHSLLDWPPLPPENEGERGPPPERHTTALLWRTLPQLLNADSIVLRPTPEMILVGERVTGSDGVTRQMVALHGPVPQRIRRQMILGVQIALSLLAIGVVGWWVTRTIARPVAALQQAAQRVAAGDLSARVGGNYPQARDELGVLARDFDYMAERIEALVAHERSVLQDVSHELRSPLARLQLILELARQDNGAEAAAHLARADHEIGRLDLLIGELLALSRMEADLPGMTREAVDLAALAEECMATAELDAQVHQSRMRLDAPQPLEVSGNTQLLGRALDNLLNNAIKYGGDGEIAVGLRRQGGRAELSVRDHGPGVPEEELGKLFRPFFRGANGTRAEGHGLGLAIVERVVRAHGGTVAAANAAGGGLRVTLSLPLIDSGGADGAAA